MRDKDPNSREDGGSTDATGSPRGAPDPRIGIPDDDDDIFKGSILEEPSDAGDSVEQPVDDSNEAEDAFAEISVEDPPGQPPLEVAIDVDDDPPSQSFPSILLASGEVSLVAPLPRGLAKPPPPPPPAPEADAPKVPTAPTKRTSAAQLRHDLRTPFNQIFGYSEMLLEDADANGDEFVGSHIRQLLSDGKQLLNVIDELLDPKAQRPSMERLNRDLLFPLSHLRTHVERLVQVFRQGDREEVAGDIEKILDAVHRLDQIVSDGAINRILQVNRPAPEPSQTQIQPVPPKPTVPRSTDTGKTTSPTAACSPAASSARATTSCSPTTAAARSRCCAARTSTSSSSTS